MALILVGTPKNNGTSWTFQAEVLEEGEKKSYEVTMSKDYFEKLRGDSMTKPEDLIRNSFDFLLRREAKESILTRFDMADIVKVFPDFEQAIKQTLF